MNRIFYVEDEPFLAKIVKETLEQKEFVVSLFENGAKAIENFETKTYDCCVLDIMLPGVSGFDVAREIRKVDTTIPILFLTAKDQTADVIQGFQSGGNDYIKKPFSIEELIARINNLISLTSEKLNSKSAGQSIKIGSIYEFSPSRQILQYGNSSKNLSYKESRILELLASQLNEAVERKKILLNIWNDDSFYNSRNLDVYITKLRGYLKEDASVSLLTLKGVGYRLSTE